MEGQTTVSPAEYKEPKVPDTLFIDTPKEDRKWQEG